MLLDIDLPGLDDDLLIVTTAEVRRAALVGLLRAGSAIATGRLAALVGSSVVAERVSAARMADIEAALRYVLGL